MVSLSITGVKRSKKLVQNFLKKFLSQKEDLTMFYYLFKLGSEVNGGGSCDIK